MTLANPAYADPRRDPIAHGTVDGGAHASAVAWGAIFAGAAAAAVLSLILLVLGTGLGLSSMSPWAQEGASAKTLGVSGGIWIILMQLAASALGGYMAGRLRTRWLNLDTDEVVFRDTAHGFLAWSVATLATAALLTSTVTSLVSGGVRAGAAVAGGAASTATAAADSAKSDGGPMGYFVDQLFRSPKGRPAGSGAGSEQAASAEVTRIFTSAVAAGKLPPEDARYVAQVVSQRSGLSQQEAEKRVNETFANLQAKLKEAETAAKEAADKARKASAAAALLLFISLLIGAFLASLCAIYGGRRRDALT
jgi:polyhydroxyalkanoate synthesis regulator phasin